MYLDKSLVLKVFANFSGLNTLQQMQEDLIIDFFIRDQLPSWLLYCLKYTPPPYFSSAGDRFGVIFPNNKNTFFYLFSH